MTIKTKLRLAILSLMGILVAFSLLAFQRMDRTTTAFSLLAEDTMRTVIITGEIDTATSDLRGAQALLALATEEEDKRRYIGDIARLQEEIARWRKEYEPFVDTAEEIAASGEFTRDYQAYLAATARLATITDRAEAARLLKDSAKLFESFSAALARMAISAQKDGDAAAVKAKALAADGRVGSTIGVVMALTLGFAGLWLVDVRISRPVAGLTGTLGQLADGDLDIVLVDQGRQDEIGAISRAVGRTVAAVRGLAGDLRILGEAAAGGVLSARADVGGHQGEYAGLISGLNALVEQLTRPLFEVVEVMQRLAAGDLRGRMNGAYEGDLRALKANLNRSLDALVNLLGEIGTVAQGLAEGDLTRGVVGGYQGDFAVLRANVNQGLDKLRGLVAHIVADTEQIAAATSQTNAAAHQVAEESDRQMVSLTAVACAVEQTAAAVREIAAGTCRGRDLAEDTSRLAEDGRERLMSLARSVDRVAASHERIERITGKITRISDKTHILSLNAGIEAARAGAEGAGFALVAQQIGRLAEEASDAARDIEEIIRESSAVVREGVASSGEARVAIARIAEAARDSGEAVQGISAAIEEQSATVKELAERLSVLRVGAEGNAAAADEIRATMEELARLAHGARDQLSRFKLA